MKGLSGGDVAVVNIEPKVNEDTESQARQEAVIDAIQRARHHAESIAEEESCEVQSLKHASVGSPSSVGNDRGVKMKPSTWASPQLVSPSSRITIPSAEAKSMEITAEVDATFDID